MGGKEAGRHGWQRGMGGKEAVVAGRRGWQGTWETGVIERYGRERVMVKEKGGRDDRDREVEVEGYRDMEAGKRGKHG